MDVRLSNAVGFAKNEFLDIKLHHFSQLVPAQKKHRPRRPRGGRFFTLAPQKSKFLKAFQGVAGVDISDPGSPSEVLSVLFLVWSDSASSRNYKVVKSSMIHIRVATHRDIFSRTLNKQNNSRKYEFELSENSGTIHQGSENSDSQIFNLVSLGIADQHWGTMVPKGRKNTTH